MKNVCVEMKNRSRGAIQTDLDDLKKRMDAAMEDIKKAVTDEDKAFYYGAYKTFREDKK